MFTKFVAFLIKFRRSVLIGMALITGFFMLQITHMEMFTQFLDLFPKNHPYVEIHKLYAKYFGGAYQATVVLEVKEGNVFNLETLQKIYDIQYDVDLIPGVDHFAIFSLASPKVTVTKETDEGFVSNPIMEKVPQNDREIDELKKKVFTSPVNGTLVSADGKALLLTANFIEGRVDFTDIFNKFMEIKHKEEDGNHRIYLSGTPLLYGWIYHYLPQMAIMLVITSIIILGMLYTYMSRGRLWWYPFLGAVMCSIWGLGFSALFGFHFDPLIIVIPFLLSARAMSHGVQWVERFTEEYQKLGDIQEAALVTGSNLFPPGLIGIVADAWALLVISFAPIPTLRNLAYLGTFWAVASIFTVLVLFPPLFAARKSIKSPRELESRTEQLLGRMLHRMAAWTSWTYGKGKYATVSVSLIVLAFAVISSLYLKYGDANPGSPILWPDSEYNTDIKNINNRFPGVDQMWVAIEGKGKGAITSPDVVKGMEELKQFMLRDPNVGFATSVADLVKNVNMLARGNDPKMEYIPDDQKSINDLLFLYRMSSAPGDMDQWVNNEFSASNVRLFLKNHEGSTLTEVIHSAEGFIKNNPKLMENAVAKPAGGLGGILAAANEVIHARNHPILILILIVIFIFCSVTYRSMVAGFIFTLSLILANFLAFSYMVFKGIGLNINTFPVVSLGIGLGVDYGLYIVSRMIEIYRVEPDLGKAVEGAITTAGRAVFFTATMMSAGVFVWYFSPLRFQAEMGVLLGILMMVNMLVGVFLLPAVIGMLRPRFVCGTERKTAVATGSTVRKPALG